MREGFHLLRVAAQQYQTPACRSHVEDPQRQLLDAVTDKGNPDIARVKRSECDISRQKDKIMDSPSANLDALRSLAVIFVVGSHLLLDNFSADTGDYHIQALGTIGVLIFFVHTCLVLMLSLEREAKMEGANPKTIPFLVVRAFRIYPLSIIVVIVLSAIGWTTSGTQQSLFTIASNILLIQNLTGSESVTPVLWSLPFEFQMYFFLPGLYSLISHSGKFAYAEVVALWVGTVALVYVFWRLGWDFNLIKFFPCFLPGVLAFCRRRSARVFSAWVLFLYVGAMALIYPWLVAHGVKSTILSWPFCLVLGFIIPKCREIQWNLLRIPGAIIARYSYGIYLVHVPILYFSFHYLRGIAPLASWAIFAFGVAGLACCAYHFVEKPCTAFGRRVVERLGTYRTQAGRSRSWMDL